MYDVDRGSESRVSWNYPGSHERTQTYNSRRLWVSMYGKVTDVYRLLLGPGRMTKVGPTSCKGEVEKV